MQTITIMQTIETVKKVVYEIEVPDAVADIAESLDADDLLHEAHEIEVRETHHVQTETEIV